jgi:hypothetical protein
MMVPCYNYIALYNLISQVAHFCIVISPTVGDLFLHTFKHVVEKDFH